MVQRLTLHEDRIDSFVTADGHDKYDIPLKTSPRFADTVQEDYTPET